MGQRLTRETVRFLEKQGGGGERRQSGGTESRPIGVGYRLIDRSVQPIGGDRNADEARVNHAILPSLAPPHTPPHALIHRKAHARRICRVSSTPPSLSLPLSSPLLPRHSHSVSIIMARAVTRAVISPTENFLHPLQ